MTSPAAGLLGALAVGWSAWVFGHAVLGRLGFAEARTPALTVTLGLGLIAQALFFVGLFGLFQPSFLLAALLSAHLACRRSWRQIFENHLRLPFWALRGRLLRPSSWLAVLVLAPIVWLALYPPTGWDETAYHLPYVRAFMEAGGLVFVEHLRYPVFPQTAEMLFLLAMLLGGDIAAALTQTLALVLAGLLLAEWGARTFSKRVGLWAAALWLGTPLVVWLGTMAYVDILLTLFVIAAFYCWQRWRDGETFSFLLLAGVFVGLAAGTKYLGLAFCGLLGVLTLTRSLRLRRLGPAVAITVVATLVLAPWYARILWHTGNPVFPFYAPVFGESEWTSKHDRLVFEQSDGGGTPKTAHFRDGLATLATLPWTAVFEREKFSRMAPLTPWYLVLLPLTALPLLFGRGRDGAAGRRLAACFLAYGFFWLGLEHDLRFLLPGLPLLNLALLAALERSARIVRQGPVALLVSGLLLLPGWLYAGYKILEKGPLPLDRTSRADFLEKQVPGYGGVRWLNERLGDDYVVLTLFAGRLRHYADGRLFGDAWGPDGHDRIRNALKAGELEEELDRRGAGYFLVDRTFVPRGPEHLERGYRLVWQGGSFALYTRPEPRQWTSTTRGNPGP